MRLAKVLRTCNSLELRKSPAAILQNSHLSQMLPWASSHQPEGIWKNYCSISAYLVDALVHASVTRPSYSKQMMTESQSVRVDAGGAGADYFDLCPAKVRRDGLRHSIDFPGWKMGCPESWEAGGCPATREALS